MDKKIMKENIGDNTKKSSFAGSVIVRWRWSREKKYRDFLKLRRGGDTETPYDLELKYNEKPFEKESVLIYSDQISGYSADQKKTKIKQLLSSEDWLWNPDQKINFDKEIDRIV